MESVNKDSVNLENVNTENVNLESVNKDSVNLESMNKDSVNLENVNPESVYIENVDKCNRCGNCQYYCPTFAASRRETHVARGRLQLIKKTLENKVNGGGGDDDSGGGGGNNGGGGGNSGDGDGDSGFKGVFNDSNDVNNVEMNLTGETKAVYSDSFIKRINQCLLCGNCSQNCPAGICTEEIVENIRKIIVERTGPSQQMGLTARNISNEGNITGDNRENRLLWLDNMESGSVRVLRLDNIESRSERLLRPGNMEAGLARQLQPGNMIAGSVSRVGETAEYIYFAGCVPTLYPSSYSIPQTFSKLLNKAGLDWAILGKRENCCSYPLMIGGMAEAASAAIVRNTREIAEAGAKCLVTTCPSCYHMWKEIYPKTVANMPDIKILHSAQLLAELAKAGAFRFKETRCTVTYHDPCDLGRKSGIYDEPRQIINSIPGVRLNEMRFSRKNAFCCGGGGNLEMNDTQLSGKVARLRVEQAIGVGAEIIVTSCQQCKRTLAGGARQIRSKIKIMDLSEFILHALE